MMTYLSAALTAFVLFIGTITAQAPGQQPPGPQPPPGQQPPGQQQEERVRVTDQQVQAVAEAYLEILKIQTEFKPQIEAAQNPDQARQLQQQANNEMHQVVEDQDGLKAEEYNMIVQAAQTDQQLALRINNALKELQEEEAEKAQNP